MCHRHPARIDVTYLSYWHIRLILIYILSEIMRRIRAVCARTPTQHPSNYRRIFNFLGFLGSSRRQLFFDRAHKTPPAFQLSRRVCPTAALYLRKFIQRCILPAVLHLSRCNAIPSKINETRCRCFFSTGEIEDEERKMHVCAEICLMMLCWHIHAYTHKTFI